MNLLDQLTQEETLEAGWDALHKRPFSYGLDDVTVADFRVGLRSNLREISKQLANGEYVPTALRGHPIPKDESPKPEKEFRILKIPAVRDRVVQKSIEILISPHLNKHYQLEGNGISFAYVKGGGVDKAANAIRNYYKAGDKYVYKADIQKFFDNINKRQLLDKINAALPDDTLMPIITLFLDTDIGNRQAVEERTLKTYSYDPLIGIAQGSPLSPIFANVFLADIDKKAKLRGLHMVRYADDVAVLCKTQEEAQSAHVFLSAELSRLNLKVHDILLSDELPIVGQKQPKYSTVTKYSKTLFLGLQFKGDKIYPSGTAYVHALKSVRGAANDRSKKLANKIISIKARIDGWCSSYAFTDYLDEPLVKNDAELEKILVRMLRYHGLKLKSGKTAFEALGYSNFKQTLTRYQSAKQNDIPKL